MKKTPLDPRADLLQRYASGEIDLQELKASQLGIDMGGVNFSLTGFEQLGCVHPIQIDELITPGGEEIFVPCVDAFFYTPRPGSVVIKLGQKTPDPDLVHNAPRKPSDMACLSVMDELGSRSPGGWTAAEEQSYNQKLEVQVVNRRKSLKTILS